jgi:hypothetical protein
LVKVPVLVRALVRAQELLLRKLRLAKLLLPSLGIK